jgi:hypothetical protein
MKKLILIAAVAFTACGSPSTQETNCDSTCVDSTCVDSTKAIDTLNTRGEVDTTIIKAVK